MLKLLLMGPSWGEVRIKHGRPPVKSDLPCMLSSRCCRCLDYGPDYNGVDVFPT